MSFKRISLIVTAYIPVLFLVLSFLNKDSREFTLGLFWLSLATYLFALLISYSKKGHWLFISGAAFLMMIASPFSFILWPMGLFVFPLVLIIYSATLQIIISKRLFVEEEKKRRRLYRVIYLLATILIPIFMLLWLLGAVIHAID